MQAASIPIRSPVARRGALRALAALPLAALGGCAAFDYRGWIHGRKPHDYVNDGVGHRPLERLPRRVVVVAAEREGKAPRFFVDGNAGVAVRASSAMPGILSPVGIAGREYEDGDEALPVAVSAARAAGASFVIAVDVSVRADATPPEAPAWMRRRDLARRARIEPEVAGADVLIHPDLDYWAGPGRSYFVEARRIGEATTRERLPEVLARLGAAGLPVSARHRGG